MNHNTIYLKSAIPTLALSLALSGEIISPGTAFDNPPLPQRPPIEIDKPQPNTEDGLQPLSDLDGAEVQTHI